MADVFESPDVSGIMSGFGVESSTPSTNAGSANVDDIMAGFSGSPSSAPSSKKPPRAAPQTTGDRPGTAGSHGFQAATATPLPGAPAPDWKNMPLSQVGRMAGQNLLPSAGEFVGSLAGAVMHPVATVKAMGDVARGAGSELYGAMGGKRDPQMAQQEAAFDIIKNHYGDIYGPLFHGDTSGLKKAIATDPVGTGMDLSTIVGVPSGALKLAGVGAEVAGAARTAAALKLAGNIGSSAASMVDPVQAAIKLGKAGTNVAGSLVRGAHSISTEVSPEFLKTASEAGATPFSPLGRSFVKHWAGAGTPTELQITANKALQSINKEGAAAHNATMAGMAGQPSYQPIIDAIKDARAQYPAGISNTMYKPVHDALDDIENMVSDHIKSSQPIPGVIDPSYSGVLGMDNLKKALWDKVGEHSNPLAKNAVKQIWASARQSLADAVPGYTDAMEESQENINRLNDMVKTLGLSGNASATSSLRKSLKAMKTESGKSLYDELIKRDPSIAGMLAGQATREIGSHNLLNAILSQQFGLGLAPFVVSSPKLAGAAHYAAGLAGGAAGQAMRWGSRPAYYATQAMQQNSPNDSQEQVRAPIPAQVAAPPTTPTPFSPKTSPEVAPVKYTPDDVDAMTKMIVAEAGREPDEGKLGVAYSVINRHKAGGEDLWDVVNRPSAYEGVSNGRARAVDPNSPEYQYVRDNIVLPALRGEVKDPTNGATHFLNPVLQANQGRLQPSWSTKDEGLRIGNHVFHHPGYQAVAGYKSSQFPDAAATGGRITRAAGGQVGMTHEQLVNHLMTRAKQAKRATDNTTKPLLNAPDEAIVKALDVAQQAI